MRRVARGADRPAHKNRRSGPIHRKTPIPPRDCLAWLAVIGRWSLCSWDQPLKIAPDYLNSFRISEPGCASHPVLAAVCPFAKTSPVLTLISTEEPRA